MLLACGTLQQFIPVAQITPGLATSADPLAFPKATSLEFTRASDRPWAMQREMLTPYTDGARALLMCSLHDLDPYTGSHGLDCLSVGHVATVWIVAAHTRVFSFCCYRSVSSRPPK